ncbi:MAG: hypothetical protein JXA15_08905 [Spirochaetales bacterium]|nr:hypothetical protein [Spirochaetales bacterium]
MLTPVLEAIGLALLFYVAVPLAGAFRVRSLWRSVRQRILAARLAPPWRFERGAGLEGILGRYRVEGSIEALQGETRIWVRAEDSTLVVEPGTGGVLVLPQGDPLARPSGGTGGDDDVADPLERADERVELQPWSRLGALFEGTRILAYGTVTIEAGVPVLSASGQPEGLVVIHDGADAHALERGLWAARARNEYWNPATQVGMAAGLVSMSVLAGSTLLRRAPSFVAAAALTIAFAPALPLAPPGVFALMLYRRLWNAGRVQRSRRDVLNLRERPGEAAARERAAGLLQGAAALVLSAGLAVNAWLAWILIRELLR